MVPDIQQTHDNTARKIPKKIRPNIVHIKIRSTFNALAPASEPSEEEAEEEAEEEPEEEPVGTGVLIYFVLVVVTEQSFSTSFVVIFANQTAL